MSAAIIHYGQIVFYGAVILYVAGHILLGILEFIDL
jgi:hypothetical protein